MITYETLTTTLAEREREIVQFQETREAQRSATRPARSKRESWTWRVEPGMEDAFNSLRGWLLSRAGVHPVC
jgi:hypothetical protein